MLAPNHKFALLALQVEARLDGDWLEIAPDLVAFHEAPLELPKHWREWLGTLEAQRLEKCRLFVLVAAPMQDASMLDHENRWLEHRADLFYRAMSLASVGYKAAWRLAQISHRASRQEGE